MCPDREILSAFVDGEVPSPWDEKILRHMESCAECSRIVRDYRSASNTLARTPEPDIEAAKKAVWTRVLEATRGRHPEPLWRARFFIPLPLAVAALLVFAVLSTLVVSSRMENSALRMAVFAASEITPSANQPTSMESVLSYLETQNPKATVTVQLPPGAGLQTYGKPVFMKASDLVPVMEEGGR